MSVEWRSQATENLAGKGYKPEGKSPEVEEKLSHTHLLVRSGDMLPPEFALRTLWQSINL